MEIAIQTLVKIRAPGRLPLVIVILVISMAAVLLAGCAPIQLAEATKTSVPLLEVSPTLTETLTPSPTETRVVVPTVSGEGEGSDDPATVMPPETLASTNVEDLSPEEQIRKKLDRWNIGPEQYEINVKDGKIYKPGTKIVIYDFETKKWNYDFILRMIVRLGCEATGINAEAATPHATKEDSKRSSDYRDDLWRGRTVVGDKKFFFHVKGTDSCFVVRDASVVVFRDQFKETQTLWFIEGTNNGDIEGEWVPVPVKK